jgi:ABC-type uncharacterized transport system ATPase subunit
MFDIETARLTKNYGDFAAVRNLNLRVQKGSIRGGQSFRAEAGTAQEMSGMTARL